MGGEREGKRLEKFFLRKCQLTPMSSEKEKKESELGGTRKEEGSLPLPSESIDKPKKCGSSGRRELRKRAKSVKRSITEGAG